MKPPSIHKIIYYLVALGMIFLAIKLYMAQRDMETVTTEEKYGWYYKLGIYGNFLIFIGAVLSFIMYRKYYPMFVSVCYVALILLVTLISIPEIDYYKKEPRFFFTMRGIGNFANFGLLFFAANTQYFNKLLRLFYIMCIVFLIGGFLNLGNVGLGAGRHEFLFAIRNITVVLIWIFPFFFLQDYEDKRLNILNAIIYCIIFIFILSTASRSYLIIYFIYLLVKLRHHLTSKKGILILMGTALLATGVFFFLSSAGMDKTIDAAVDVLAERATDDSRSGQLKEFIAQWDTDYLLQGVGILKTWYWTNFSDYYYFLDNQILLTAWWAGLPVAAVYLFFLIRTIFHKSEISFYKGVKGIRLMVFMWLLACLGFAIYVTISSNLYYHFLNVIMGYHLCQYSKITDFDPEET